MAKCALKEFPLHLRVHSNKCMCSWLSSSVTRVVNWSSLTYMQFYKESDTLKFNLQFIASFYQHVVVQRRVYSSLFLLSLNDTFIFDSHAFMHVISNFRVPCTIILSCYFLSSGTVQSS